MSFHFRRNEKSEALLTIVEKKLTHKEGSSELFIKFLEKMRKINTEYIRVAVSDPWLYRTSPQEQNQKVVYFKQKEYEIKIQKKKETQEEKSTKQAAKAAKIARVVLGTAASSSIFSSLLSAAGSSVVYLIIFFNILDIMSNFAKLNVNFGPKIMMVVEFLENLKIPEIGFLAKMSPLDDSRFDDPDVNAYQIIMRGSRGKMTSSNNEIFISSGQNFIISCVIITIWGLMTLLGCCLNKNSTILNILAFVYHLIFGLMLFDYLLICTSEIALFNYSALGEISSKYIFSLNISIFLMILILYKFYQAYRMIRAHAVQMVDKKNTQDSLQLPCKDTLILEKYTEMINLEFYGEHSYLMIIDNLRFFVIQIIVASLQVINRTQALLVFLVDLVYFIYFMRLVLFRDVFKNSILMIKMIVQECCILVLIFTITLFRFTERTSFSSSRTYEVIEVVTMVCLVGATGTEFLVMATNMYLELTSCCGRRKNRNHHPPR